MVAPLRQWFVPCGARDLAEGMYVVNRSNVRQHSIPRLPILKLAAAVDEVTCRSPAKSGLPLVVPHAESVFDDGDIVWMDSRHGMLKSILSARANANTLLVTERCDNRCLFCSQPPNEKSDTELYLNAALAILNFDTHGYVGISGGEPTLHKQAFLRLLAVLNQFGNRSKLHILTNGRSFKDGRFAQEVRALLTEREVLWGVPLYGHRSSLHDQLVGAHGAFIDTVDGLLNLCGTGQHIELRIVPTRPNVSHLADIVRFVVTSYPSIAWISIMNLEPKGWARANYDRLYVPVQTQTAHLRSAVGIARMARRAVRLFNYPLCLLPRDLHEHAVKSISDWKNYYPQECDGCRLRERCGGFFASAIDRFREPVKALL